MTGVLAARLTAHGVPPVPMEVPSEPPSEGAVRVAVTAAPIVPLDILCASGTSYFGPPALPYTPGVQGVGRTEDGDRVWFTTSAGMLPGDGSMAQVCSVATDRLYVIHDDVPDTLVAALGLSSVAAWGALRRGSATAGDTVVVLGAGGVVGQVAVQLAARMGAARVVAARRGGAPTEGADCVVDAALPPDQLTEALAEATGGGADLVIDPVWGDAAAAAAAALRDGGRLVNLGDSGGPSAVLSSALLRSRSVDVRGYTNLSLTWEQQCSALGEVLAAAAAGDLSVDVATYPLAEVEEAWSVHADPRHHRGRAVLVP